MKDKKIFGLQKNVFFTGLTSFFTDTSTKMIYSVMPLFLLSIGASKTSISLIEGIAESTASLIKAFSGYWSDKIGKNKPFMILGYGITALITPLYALVRLPVQVLLLRFVERTGKGLRAAPRDSLISASVLKEETGKNFGFHKAMDNSGAILGPLLAYVILSIASKNHGKPNLSDYRFLFYIAAIPALLGVATIILFIKDAKTNEKKQSDNVSFRGFDKRFYIFLAIIFIFSLGNSTDTLLLLRAKDTGINDATVALIYMMFNISSALFAVPIGIFSDKIHREKIIIAGFILYALVYFGFAYAGNAILVALLFLTYGLYSAATDGVQKALVADMIGNKNRGTGLGLYNAIIGITLLPASIMGGKLWDMDHSHAMPFVFGAIMALISTLFLVIFYNKREVKEN